MERRKLFTRMFGVQILYEHLLYVVLIALLAMFYIHNAHKAERKIRAIQSLQEDINQTRYRYWETASEVSLEGLQSETEKRVHDLGLKSGEASIKVLSKEEAELVNK